VNPAVRKRRARLAEVGTAGQPARIWVPGVGGHAGPGIIEGHEGKRSTSAIAVTSRGACGADEAAGPGMEAGRCRSGRFEAPRARPGRHRLKACRPDPPVGPGYARTDEQQPVVSRRTAARPGSGSRVEVKGRDRSRRTFGTGPGDLHRQARLTSGEVGAEKQERRRRSAPIAGVMVRVEAPAPAGHARVSSSTIVQRPDGRFATGWSGSAPRHFRCRGRGRRR